MEISVPIESFKLVKLDDVVPGQLFYDIGPNSQLGPLSAKAKVADSQDRDDEQKIALIHLEGARAFRGDLMQAPTTRRVAVFNHGDLQFRFDPRATSESADLILGSLVVTKDGCSIVGQIDGWAGTCTRFGFKLDSFQMFLDFEGTHAGLRAWSLVGRHPGGYENVLLSVGG